MKMIGNIKNLVLFGKIEIFFLQICISLKIWSLVLGGARQIWFSECAVLGHLRCPEGSV